jgi:uncharacterized SAM-binding protein YcdF (DUF218 family)
VVNTKWHSQVVDLKVKLIETARRNSVYKRLAAIFSVASVVLMLAYLLVVAQQIRHESYIHEEQPADLIIVLGAAEYRGKPSPVLQARLNHALMLYLKHVAPYILTTGGAGGDPVYTEGEVGRAYLTQHGVPSEAILVEPEGSTTAQSLASAVEIMKRMNFKSCVVVSDGYHIFRVKRMLEGRGIKVYGSPRPGTPGLTGGWDWLYLKQAIGYLLWKAGINV